MVCVLVFIGVSVYACVSIYVVHLYFVLKNYTWLPNVMWAHKINMNAQQVEVKQKIDTKWLVVQCVRNRKLVSLRGGGVELGNFKT
jgi:hypothetical protein